jgi:hypothetical protein
MGVVLSKVVFIHGGSGMLSPVWSSSPSTQCR